jgi:DNA-binding MarR family transcriptional regulator
MSTDRNTLVTEISELMRDNASLGVVLHQAIADRFGLGPSDLKCLDLARRERPLTAGRLAELTRMSTSAVTAMLDRLERAGFIERQRDASDRRRVYVHSTGRHEADLADAFRPLDEAMRGLLAGQGDAQLEFLAGFIADLNQAARGALAATAADVRAATRR